MPNDRIIGARGYGNVTCANVAIKHINGIEMYDTHLYGVTVEAGMVSRFGASRPTARPVPGIRSIFSSL